jgi:16S rRNA (uracil1498-N3)-methyltransferase
VGLQRVIDDWPAERVLFHCDEAGGAPAAAASMAQAAGKPAALLIGPVGGFEEDERAGLAARPFVRPISLGPRILCADTAALAALAIWQATVGDWRS